MARPLSTESVFRALAHATRRRILELLSRRELSAGEIAAEFKHSQPTLSRHLRVLHQSGLVSMKRRGPRVMYSLAAGAMDPLRTWLAIFPPSRRADRA